MSLGGPPPAFPEHRPASSESAASPRMATATDNCWLDARVRHVHQRSREGRREPARSTRRVLIVKMDRQRMTTGRIPGNPACRNSECTSPVEAGAMPAPSGRHLERERLGDGVDYFLPALAFGEALAPALAFVDFGAALAFAFVSFVVFAAMSVGSCITGTGYLFWGSVLSSRHPKGDSTESCATGNPRRRTRSRCVCPV